MRREKISVRIQPIYKKAIEDAEKDLQHSSGWIIEYALYDLLAKYIPRQCLPGVKSKDMNGGDVDDV